jgi:hypothetical protein
MSAAGLAAAMARWVMRAPFVFDKTVDDKRWSRTSHRTGWARTSGHKQRKGPFHVLSVGGGGGRSWLNLLGGYL